MIRICLFLVVLAGTLQAQVTLRLEDVLTSVEKNYPPLLAALQEGAIADAEYLAAKGRFDTTFRARLDNDSLSYYPSTRGDVAIEQPFATGGISAFTGYRLTDGTLASYDGRLETRDLGEWRTGLRFPLLRDRATDSRRAELRKADLGRALARLSVDQQRLLIVQSATRRYWDWVAAGKRFAIAESILQIADQRDKQLREQVDAGALPRIDVIDNERIILQRRSQLVEAERALQQAGIELSLFYRDDRGQSVVPVKEQLPSDLPLASAIAQPDIDGALENRPDWKRVQVQRDQNQVEAELAKNQRLPGVDLIAGFGRDLGYMRVPTATKVAPNELKLSLIFELPFQRRSATGKLLAAQAKERQLKARQDFARDQITAEVRDAHSALDAARRRAALLRDEVETTRRVEDAERTRYELGEGTLFVLNLREQATADAAYREIAALNECLRAQANYEYAVASALR